MAHFIFDLDGTVICSKHRQATLPDGSLDLEHWFENNTPEKIMLDDLLPLATAMRTLYGIGHNVIICTARSIQPADIAYLHLQNLRYHDILHRNMHPEGKTIGDAQLKVDLLTNYFVIDRQYNTIADAKAIMWDDNLKVIDAMRSIGIKCYNAVETNHNMAA